jgi:hypothetical protein
VTGEKDIKSLYFLGLPSEIKFFALLETKSKALWNIPEMTIRN